MKTGHGEGPTVLGDGSALSRAIGVALVVGGTAVTGPAAAAPAPLRLGLEIYAAGLHALSVDAEIRIDGAHYEGVASTRTRGLLDLMFGYRGELRSRGTVQSDGTRPLRHTAGSRSRFSTSDVEITYRADGEVSTRLIPRDEDDDPIPDRLRRDTLDPLSAFVALARRGTAEETCRGVVRVFDGRRRFDLEFSYLGSDSLAPNSYAFYAGPAGHCRARYRRVEKDGSYRPSKDPRRPPAEVWLAPLGGDGALVPVRIEAETRWGRMIAHLARFGRPKAASAP